MNNLEKMKNAAEYAKNFIGIRYWWGGNDTSAGGLDCSGLVLECLRSVGLWGKEDASAQSIFTSLCSRALAVETIQAGDLLFFGQTRQKITHIAIAISETSMIEAGGGDQKNSSGMVRMRPITWRADMVCVLRVS